MYIFFDEMLLQIHVIFKGRTSAFILLDSRTNKEKKFTSLPKGLLVLQLKNIYNTNLSCNDVI